MIGFPDFGDQLGWSLTQFAQDGPLKARGISVHLLGPDPSRRNRTLRERFGEQFESEGVAGCEQTLVGNRADRPDPRRKSWRLKQPAQRAQRSVTPQGDPLARHDRGLRPSQGLTLRQVGTPSTTEHLRLECWGKLFISEHECVIASRGHQKIEPDRGLLRGITCHHDLTGLQWDLRVDPFLGNRPAPTVKSPTPTALRVRLPDQDRHRDALIHEGRGPPAGGLRKVRDAGDNQRLGFTGRSFPRLDPRLVRVPQHVVL